MTTCLVVEDSALVREIAVRIVKDTGLKTLEAETASAGVDLCRSDRPAVVFLDWDLPAMGALDFLRGVGGFEADARPIIVLCATENDPQQFTLAKAAGAAHYILKPYDRGVIEEKLAELGLTDRARAAS